VRSGNLANTLSFPRQRISTVFSVLVSPLTIDTSLPGTPSVFAINFSTALFALPFSLGAFTLILSRSPNQPVIALRDAPAETLIKTCTVITPVRIFP